MSAAPVILALAVLAGASSARAEDVLARAAQAVSDQHYYAEKARALPSDSIEALYDAVAAFDPFAELIRGGQRSVPDMDGMIEGLGGKILRDRGALTIFPYPEGRLRDLGLSSAQRIETLSGTPVTALDFETVALAIDDVCAGSASLGIRSLESGQRRVLSGSCRRYAPREIGLFANGDVGIVQILGFSRGRGASELQLALQRLRGYTRIVIDLRYATGGNLEETVDMLETLLPPGSAVYRRINRDGRVVDVTTRKARERPLRDAQFVLLTGPGTASAAEVFAAALIDGLGAWQAGTATRGKCLAQVTIGLLENARLSFTSHYLERIGSSACDTNGLQPHHSVDAALIDSGPAAIAAAIEAFNYGSHP